MWRLLAPMLLIALPALAADELKLKPFELTYAVLDDNKPIGEAEVALKATPQGYRYTSNSTGTEGLAAMLGGKIIEGTDLEFADGALRPLSFTYEQSFALRTRKQNGRFDWAAKRATGEHKDKPWTQALSGPTVNRQLVDLTVAQAIANGATELEFDVLDRGELRHWRFKVDGEESIDTRAGRFDTIRVVRLRESADGRETRMWFAPALNYVPVRVAHTEKDGRGLALDLKVKPQF
jgi:hypothetical protein